MTTTDPTPASMGEPLSEAEQALNAATRAIATNMQRWSSDRTAPVDYFACDARELIDVGDARQLDDEAERLLAQGDFENGTLLRQIAESPDSIRQIIAQVSRLGAALFDTDARVGVLEGQLATAQEQLALVDEHIAYQHKIGRKIRETDDQLNQQRLLGHAEARKALAYALAGSPPVDEEGIDCDY